MLSCPNNTQALILAAGCRCDNGANERFNAFLPAQLPKVLDKDA